MPEIQMPNLQGSEPVERDKEKFYKRLGGPVSTLLLFLFAFLAAILLNSFVFQPYEVDGSSMEPTLQNGDRLIVFKLGKSWARITGGDFVPKRGEIVVFNRNNASKSQLIKRVVGLPGERVVVNDGTITVYNDDNPAGFNPDLDFDVQLASTSGAIDTQVGPREVFVVGDNRVPGASADSRSSIGNVSVDDLVGSLSLRIFPFSGFKGF